MGTLNIGSLPLCAPMGVDAARGREIAAIMALFVTA
jgi:hypothetical protein